jgi:filamentous hemagglutinin
LDTLPYRERATIELQKLRDYVLNPKHEIGRHKARIFKAFLGIEQRHAESLAAVIKGTLARAAAEKGTHDRYGERWTTYHEIVGVNANVAIVSVGWILRTENPMNPVFLTCYIDPDRQTELTKTLGRTP